MGQAARVPLNTHVDREQRAQLVALAAREDSSVARIVRRAVAAELERAAVASAGTETVLHSDARATFVVSE